MIWKEVESVRYVKTVWPCILAGFLLMTALPVYATAEADRVFVELTDEPRVLHENEEYCLDFTVDRPGYYVLVLEYLIKSEKGITAQTAVELYKNDRVVFSRESMDLPGIWVNQREGDRFAQDNAGNELLPVQVLQYEWQTIRLTPEALLLEEDRYTLRLSMLREDVEIRRIYVEPAAETESYSAYKTRNDRDGAADTTGQYILVEAELASGKSHQEILVSYDRLSPSISPSHPTNIRYNILGGAGFSSEGQWVEWTIPVQQTGYYALDFCYRQNLSNGLSTHRKLYLDGQELFEEASCLLFPNNETFEILTLSEQSGQPCLLYLTEGQHKLRMEVVLGDVRPRLEELSDIIRVLNGLYSKIMVIVGETPDAYRDYDLDVHIAGLQANLDSCSDRLQNMGNEMNEGLAGSGSNTARLYEAARLIHSLSKEPRSIPQKLDSLRSKINALADLLGAMRAQPLELDYLVLRSPNEKTQTQAVGFWDYICFRAKAFMGSFFKDYTSITAPDNAGKALNVWVSANDLATAGFATGRDQAQIIRQLVSDDFTLQTGVPVSLSLVNAADTLLPAIVSGKGPDAALFVPKTVFVNLYFRNALVDLSKTPNFDTVQQRFYPSALISMRVGDSVFAWPEVQSYNMMFYRTDIFEENEWQVPSTWNEFYAVLSRLQKAGMQAGISESTKIYEMFLMQNGGQLYNETVSRVQMTSQESVDAFTSWTDLYVKYGIPKSFDMLNRFRTGQMPLVLAPSYFYGQLKVGAPEIENQWAMACIPGTLTQDGSITRSESCDVSGAIILKSSNNMENALAFLEWWTSDQTQKRFAFESEARLGVSSRYFPANRSVLDTLAWTASEQRALAEQLIFVNDIPQSPITYYVTRNLTNSFRRVTYNYENPRDVIGRYGQMVNAELIRKRQELGLEDAA